MSTSPDDEIVALLSRWLARHLTNRELEQRLAEIGTDGLGPDAAEAVAELRERLERAGPAERGHVEMVVRETLEAVALGG